VPGVTTLKQSRASTSSGHVSSPFVVSVAETKRSNIRTGKASETRKSWRDARADESDGLENRCVARHRGFESHSLRHVGRERPSSGPSGHGTSEVSPHRGPRRASPGQVDGADRADTVTKSRAHEGSKKVDGPCSVAPSSLLPLEGAAMPPGVGGS